MTKLAIKLVLLIAIIAVGLFIGPKLIGEKGYVLITFGQWKIELTVISAVIMLLGSYFFVWLLLRIVSTLLALTGFSANWIAQFSSRHRKQRFFTGMIDAIGGQLEAAEKQLKGIAGTEWHGLDWLSLAEIARQKGQEEQCLEYLEAAFKLPSSQLVALQKLHEYFKSHDQQKRIESYLDELDEKHKKHNIARSVQADLLATNGQWQLLQERLPGWKKNLTKSQYDKLSKEAALGSYSEIASKKGANELKSYWRMAPRKDKKDSAHQRAYIELLINQNMHVDAETELLELQAKQPNVILLPLFKQLRLQNPTNTLQRLESWLKQDGNNLQLLDIIAEVSLNSGDHELADKVLKKRLAIQPDARCTLMLARSKTEQNDLQSAIELYQQIS